jgi:hypothetical protein
MYRSRPRTFPYRGVLPYKTETPDEEIDHLNHIIGNLYIAIKGDDLKGVVGNTTGSSVTHWTRELRSWIELKFDMPLDTRIKLIKLYYSLALAGVDGSAMEKFINMFCLLCKDDKFQDTVQPADLDLDWRTLVLVMRKLAFPQQSSYDGNISKAFSALSRLAQVARHLIDPHVTLTILKEILPHVSIFQLVNLLYSAGEGGETLRPVGLAFARALVRSPFSWGNPLPRCCVMVVFCFFVFLFCFCSFTNHSIQSLKHRFPIMS